MFKALSEGNPEEIYQKIMTGKVFKIDIDKLFNHDSDVADFHKFLNRL